jgi:hypothetical protein
MPLVVSSSRRVALQQAVRWRILFLRVRPGSKGRCHCLELVSCGMWRAIRLSLPDPAQGALILALSRRQFQSSKACNALRDPGPSLRTLSLEFLFQLSFKRLCLLCVSKQLSVANVHQGTCVYTFPTWIKISWRSEGRRLTADYK